MMPTKCVFQVEDRAVELWKNMDIRSCYPTGSRHSPLSRVVKTNVEVQTVSEPLCLQVSVD